MTFDIYELGLLLTVTTAVALICERLRLPYTIGLVLAGLALAAMPVKIELPLTKDFVYTFLLPPLVFEAALRLSWPRLRRDLPVILTLAGQDSWPRRCCLQPACTGSLAGRGPRRDCLAR